MPSISDILRGRWGETGTQLVEDAKRKFYSDLYYSPVRAETKERIARAARFIYDEAWPAEQRVNELNVLVNERATEMAAYDDDWANEILGLWDKIMGFCWQPKVDMIGNLERSLLLSTREDLAFEIERMKREVKLYAEGEVIPRGMRLVQGSFSSEDKLRGAPAILQTVGMPPKPGEGGGKPE